MLCAVAIRSQETLWSVRAQLYGDVESRSLLVKNTGGPVIAQSMQLIAGRTAQHQRQSRGSTVQ
jgi:hypothetical protein